jgi:hypothetical protein
LKNKKIKQTKIQKKNEISKTFFLPILSESLPKGIENKEATAVKIKYKTGIKPVLKPNSLAKTNKKE